MSQSSQQLTYNKRRPVSGLRDPYNLVSLSLRKRLIKMVCEENMTIYRACKLLKINYSTGKSIIKSYQRRGSIFARKHQQIERDESSRSFQEEAPENQQRQESNPQIHLSQHLIRQEEGNNMIEADSMKYGYMFPLSFCVMGYYPQNALLFQPYNHY